MPNIAKVLREEIQRLARKLVKGELRTLRRDNIRLKKSVAELRRQLAALNRTSTNLVKLTPVAAAAQIGEATEEAVRLRPTAKSLKNLRARLGLTQAQFGNLLGVSGHTVVQWANRAGRVRMRKKTLAALAAIQHIGKREARRRMERMAEAVPARKKGRRKEVL